MPIIGKAKKKLPKLSRSIPYRGEPIYQYRHSRLYKCWYCGHVNTVGREVYDTGDMTMNTTYGAAYTVSNGARDGKLGVLSVNRSIFGYRVAPKAGADGLPARIKNEWTIVSRIGCSACGTLTWGPGAARR